MVSMAGRMGMMLIASFTLTMLLGATTDWAVRGAGGTDNLKLVLWVFFPATFVLCSVVLEYIEYGSLPRALRASFFNAGFVAALILVLYGVAVALS